ncbi:FAD-dependent oxidoreductase [Gorillibacterium sp. sgz5001074]|uniref:FAD-dependent oxidoreductase n=1 Tax=Gorillibacterium sp. sgz5001074 TaxID=3446695 RepID=UPI003F671714
MKYELVQSDVTVIGGGLAGICAAVSAARLGRTVSLVHNRGVLGGNSSSEVRVWVCGATAHGTHRFARETGVMGEMFVENQYRNPEGNPYLWDLTLLETVRAEPNIRLFLNTDVHEVAAEGDADNRSIQSVTGWMMGSERRITFESKMFLDCTGDGLVGFLAGAKYRIGREARHEFNEDWAPEVADDITLGSTLLFYTKDTGAPVKFVPPSFAKDITKTTIPMKRVIRSGDSGCHYWWIEWGGELDTVHENERIRDELWSAIYGIWDFIKNSGQFDADNMALEWVGSMPGKREYRRFIGDYVLTQEDVVTQKAFEDRVAFGGWSIDLHPPQGMYSTESGSKHLYSDGVYHIPFRSLYSANCSNLMFAGRNVSATHVAFGTIRVMATCAVMGEAAGTGAALAVEKGVTPRELYTDYLQDLQMTLLKQDASVIGLKHTDARDLAPLAAVTASSCMQRPALETSAGTYALERDAGLLFPVEPSLGSLELLVDAAKATEVTVELWDTGLDENYVPANLLDTKSVRVEAGERQWAAFGLEWTPERARNAFVVVKANPDVKLHLSEHTLSGVLTFSKGEKPRVSSNMEEQQPEQPVVQWSMRGLVRKPFCFRSQAAEGAASTVYHPAKAVDGYLRPYGGPHMWLSAPMEAGRAEYLELAWTDKADIGEVELIWNDDVNEDLINLHHHRTPFDIMPELVKDYRVEAKAEGEWIVLASGTGNRKRKISHKLAQPVSTDAIRVVAESTNGSRHAELVAVRALRA